MLGVLKLKHPGLTYARQASSLFEIYNQVFLGQYNYINPMVICKTVVKQIMCLSCIMTYKTNPPLPQAIFQWYSTCSKKLKNIIIVINCIYT